MADIGFVEMLVAFHLDMADARFDHPQVHHAMVELLFRQHHAHDVVAFVAIRRFQRLDRLLHRAEIAVGPGVARQQAIDIAGRQERIALHLEARNLEMPDRIGRLRLPLPVRSERARQRGNSRNPREPA